MGELAIKNADEFAKKNFSILSLFEECAEKYKDKVALIFEDRSLSYGELNAAANQLAHYLQQQGITKETPIAICLERSFSLIISLLAVLKAGGTYVPLDPSYPEERISYMLQDTKAPIIITQKAFEKKLNSQESSVLIWETLTRITKDFPTNNPLSPATPDSLAYIIYTSGSTGQPKGVMIEHQSLYDRFIVLQTTFPLNKEDRILFHTSISFDVSLEEILWPLAYGSIIIIAGSGLHQDIENFSKIISDHKVTFLQVVPSFLKTFLYLPHLKETFRTVRQIFVGAEALSFSLLKNCIKELPHIEFINVYGPTEATVDSTFFRCSSSSLVSEKYDVPIGTPLEGVRIYLLDEQLKPVRVGEKGEICIAGLGLARGYFNLPCETADKFFYLPSMDERVFRTGDLGRFSNIGQLEFLGRCDNQVKINGVRIEIEEIENTLNDNSYIIESAVLLNEMKTGFDAYVVLNDNLKEKSQIEKEVFLKNSIEKRLLSLMIPKQFIFMDSLPKNPNGKIDRQKLIGERNKSINKKKDPDPITMNEEEEKLIAIWKALLKVDSVTINDNFFTLGGDSLTAVQMVLAAGREGIKIAIDKLFQTPTLKELISESSLKKVEELPVIQPAKKHASYPLSFNQQSLWFFHHFSPEKNVYNVPFAFLINEKINGEILQKALLMLIKRHESLRTIFIFDDQGHGVQKILEEVPFYLLENDLSSLSKQFQNQKLREFIEKDMDTPFDLEQAPLLRIRLLKFNSSHFALILTLHHIIADGYSMRLFFRDLQVYYKAIVDKKAPILPNLTIQYKDFSVWQRDIIKSRVIEKQLLYWKGKLKSRDEDIKLADFSRPQFLSYKGTTHFTTLSFTLAEKIESFTRTMGGTNFITFVSVFNILLSFFTDKRDIIIGSPFMNRSSINLENVIGFLANPLPIYVKVDFQKTFADHYQEVKKVIQEAIENQNIPLEYIIDELGVSRTSSINPLFQVMFVLEENKIPYSLNEVNLEKINIQSHTSKLDLTLTVIKEDLETICEFEYSTELFKASAIKNLALCWEKLLSIIVVNPIHSIEEIYSILKNQVKIK